MIAEANVRSMERLKCTFMALSFASADTFRRSLIDNRTLLPHVMSKRGGPAHALREIRTIDHLGRIARLRVAGSDV